MDWFYLFLVSGFYTCAYAQEQIEILTYYPAPCGVYKELRVGPNDDFIRIFDNNNPIDYGTVIQPSDGTLNIQGTLNIFNETGDYVITVGSSSSLYNLIKYNAAGAGLTIGDNNATGPVTVEHAFGIKTAYTNSSFSIVSEMLSNPSSLINGIRIEHNIDNSNDTYGITIDGKNETGNFTAGNFTGDEYGIYASGGEYAGYFNGKLKTTDTMGTKHVYDIAELIPCNKDIEYGDVVIIDMSENRKVLKCSVENQNGVAGVISENPQLSIGDKEIANKDNPEKNYNYLALAGQVYCNVDASYGEIQPGDLLTTSPTPGHAMKVKPIGEINGYPNLSAGLYSRQGTRGIEGG